MMWFIFLAVWCAGGCASGAVPARDKPFYPDATHAQHFAEFKVTYQRQYATPEEEQYRFNVFKENLAKINKLNLENELAVYGINKFADMTEEDMFATDNGLEEIKALNCTLEDDLPDVDKPYIFDWREKNAVTSVKDQGKCKSSWAFAMTGLIEAQYAIKHKELVDFSAQQLIDCDRNSDGCNGGNIFLACGYLEREGLMKEKDYPFIDQNSTVNTHKCTYKPEKVVVRATGCRNYADLFDVENRVNKIVFLKGPVAGLMDGGHLLHYNGGIIQDCIHHDNLNHAVLLIGYGFENGVPYWIVKNSWGEQWGEKGYFRIQRFMSCLGLLFNYAISADIQ